MGYSISTDSNTGVSLFPPSSITKRLNVANPIGKLIATIRINDERQQPEIHAAGNVTMSWRPSMQSGSTANPGRWLPMYLDGKPSDHIVIEGQNMEFDGQLPRFGLAREVPLFSDNLYYFYLVRPDYPSGVPIPKTDNLDPTTPSTVEFKFKMTRFYPSIDYSLDFIINYGVFT